MSLLVHNVFIMNNFYRSRSVLVHIVYILYNLDLNRYLSHENGMKTVNVD